MLTNAYLRWMDRIYGLVIKVGSNLQSLFILYLRLTWGHQFFLIGLDKLQNINSSVQLFSKLDVPSPFLHSFEIGLLELIGGSLLIIGFASRLIAIPLIFLMISALSMSHAEYFTNLKMITDPRLFAIEQPYPFLFTSLIVFLFGPGRISIDAWIKRWVDRQPRY